MNNDNISNIIKLIKDSNSEAYKTLISYGISEKENDTFYPDSTSKWKQYFSNVQNINCDPNIMFGFCYFKNGNLAGQTINQIKMYIPLDKDHIIEGTMRIFRFLAHHNIIHSSKVRKEFIRNDNIVVRLGNKEDAIKVINFINQDQFLQESSISANPFTIKDGKIGLVCDGLYSYNSTVCDLINMYLGTNPNEPEKEAFKNWLSNWYKETFKEGNKENLESLKNIGKHNYIYGFNKLNTEAIMTVNIKQIVEILMMSLDETKTIKDFFKYYDQISNEEEYRKDITETEKYITNTKGLIEEINPNEEELNPVEVKQKIEIPFTYEEFIDMEKKEKEEKNNAVFSFLPLHEKIKLLRKKEIEIRDTLNQIKNYNSNLMEIKKPIILDIMSLTDEEEINKRLEEEGLIVQKRLELQIELKQTLNQIKSLEEIGREKIISREHEKIKKMELKHAKKFLIKLENTIGEVDINGLSDDELLELYNFYKENPLGKTTYEEAQKQRENETQDNYLLTKHL